MTYTLQSTARKTAVAALAMALPAVLIPTSAFADSYGSGYNSHNPHEACKTDEQQDKLIGAVIGGVIGGVLGSQVSGNGARTEGSAIGAGIGALAGAGIADKQTDCDPNYGRNYNSRRTNNYERNSYGTNTYGTSTYGSGRYQQQPVYNPQPVYTPPRTVYQSPVYQQPRPVYTSSRSYPVHQTPVYKAPVYKKPKRHKSHRHNSYHTPVYSGRTQHQTRHYQARPVRLTGTHYHGEYVCHGTH